MKKALITGSTGFLGKNFKKYIEKKGFKVFESNQKTNNLIYINNNEKLKKQKFDFIFHFAAFTKSTRENFIFQSDIWNINNQINFNIVNFWINYQSQAKFITTSSSCIYSPEVIKIEKNCFLNEPEKALYHYGLSKRNLMQSLISASNQFDMSYSIFIPTILYGPNFQYEDKHFIYDIIRKINNAKIKNSYVFMEGSGTNKRDLVYIDDAIRIIYKSIFLKENSIVNLTNKNHKSIYYYTKCIAQYMNFDPSKIVFKKYFDDNIKIRNLSSNKLNKLFPNFDKTPLEKGLINTINFFNKNYA